MATVIDSLLIELGIDASKFNSEQKKIVADLKKISEEAEKTANAEVESSKKAEDATKKTGAEKKKSATEDKKTTVEKKKASEEENKAGKQSDKIAKETHLNTKKTADGFDKAKDALLGFGTAFLGLEGIKALNAMVSETAKNNAELSRQSTILGVPSEDLQSWGALAKVVGGAEEDVIGSLQSIQSALTDFATWGGSQGAIVSASILQLDTKDIDKFDVVAEKVKKYIEDTKDKMPGGETAAIQRAKQFTSQFGYNETTFKMLLLGGDALRNLQEELKKTGHVTQTLTAESVKYTEATGRLDNSWIGLKNTFAEGILPGFTKLIDLVANAIGYIADLNAEFVSFGKDLDFKFLDILKEKIGWINKVFHTSISTDWIDKTKQSLIPEETVVGPGGPITNTGATRGNRNNNRGNLHYESLSSAQAAGATGLDKDRSGQGGFGIFPSVEAGDAAMDRLLKRKYEHGLQTIHDLYYGKGKTLGYLGGGKDLKEAPSAVSNVTKSTGFGEYQHLTIDQLSSLKQGMMMNEGTVSPSKSDASMVGSRNNASMVGSRANVPIGSNSNSSSNTQVTVNGVTVNTKATDGDGIARDLGQAIKDNSMVYNGVGGTLK